MSALAETLAERGAMMTSLAKFLDRANEQDTALLAEILYAWDDCIGYTDQDSEQLEAILFEAASLAGERREKPRDGEPWPKITGALWRSSRGCLAQGAVKFALEQNNERIAELHDELGRLIGAAEGRDQGVQVSGRCRG